VTWDLAVIWAGLRIRINFIRIRIQGFNEPKMKKKITAEKKNYFFLSKTTIYISLSLHKERPSDRRSLQLSKAAIQTLQNMNF
jgi:hypothetical protein